MNIQKNNYYTSYNTKFGARFPKADLQKVMSEISYMPKLERKEKLARLYTSLKYNYSWTLTVGSSPNPKNLNIKKDWINQSFFM